MIVLGLIVAAVASVAAKKRLEAMTDDEIRAYLASKLDGKIGEDQLATVQDAAVAGIRKAGRRAVEPAEPDSESPEADTDINSESADDAS